MFRKISIMLIVLILTTIVAVASAANVPKFMNYQAVLFDDGGNPLPDGPMKVTIRILDTDLNVAYEEEQEVEVVAGIVSIMVGEGLDPLTGAPTGGIDSVLLLPDGPKYLEIQAEGYPSEGLMELVSVPYSTYADVALQVANDGVSSESIKDGSIKTVDLSGETISELATQIAESEGGPFAQYKDSISSTDGASQIGVTPGLNYSSATNIQDVLEDFDHAIKKRSEDAKMSDVRNLSLDGSDAMTGSINMSGNKIEGLSLPLAEGDASSKQYVDNQIGAITPAGIGAVSSAELYGPDGTINPDKMPSFSISQDIGNGRIAVTGGNWGVDDSNTSLDCSLSDGGASELGWQVKCELQKTPITCGQFNLCSYSDEVIPQFQLYTDVTLNNRAMVPTSFNRLVMATNEYVSGTQSCYCIEEVTFYVGDISFYSEGSSISWKFYRRQLSVQ